MMRARPSFRIPKKNRLISMMMVLVLILGCCFAQSAVALGEGDSAARVADPNTADEWVTDLGPGVEDTSSAGQIWTDKSVYDQDSVTLANVDGHETIQVGRQDQNSFLVSLSALSSTKSIVGQETIPIDVMLVLDLSASMYNSHSVGALVDATNNAIQELQSLNPNNRVGVVAYSGNAEVGDSSTSTATVLLPLGRYQSSETYENSTDQIFLKYGNRERGYWESEYDRNGNITWTWHDSWRGDIDWNGSQNRVSISSGVSRTDGGSFNRYNRKTVEGGTYIQNGLYQAWEQFEQVDDTEVDGVNRIPVLVLMSDGAPTAATTSYTNVEDSEVGTGQYSSSEIGFLTQLTAAYVRGQMEEHYGREALFYTLGLGLDDLENRDVRINDRRTVWSPDRTVAKLVMDPTATMDRWDDSDVPDNLENWWSRFVNLPTSGNNNSLWLNGTDRVTVRRTTDGLQAGDQYYVDRYFPASDADDLSDAFANIIREIYIQSEYYPTDVAGAGPSLSGYVTFEDEIGPLMEVTNINSLVYGDVQYTGAEFAQHFANRWSSPDDADEFAQSVAERLGITETQAAALIQNARNKGQLYYNSQSDFGNAIAWYGGGDSATGQTYEGAYSEGSQQPSNARYLNRSYFFYADIREQEGSGEGEITKESNLMYITVRVVTDLETGDQTVVLKIPASLVPMVEYRVDIPGNSLEDATKATTTRVGASPMHLFYEVGVRDDVTADNIQFKAGGDYPYYDEESETYSLYTNAWTDGDPKEANTTVTFQPSGENEFYYYYRNTKIYYQDYSGQYVLCDDESDIDPDNPNRTYYYKQQTFRISEGQVDIEEEWVAIDVRALREAQWRTNGGYWYIPSGTPRYKTSPNDPNDIGETLTEKEENPTQTAGYVIDSDVTYNENDNDKISVEAYLGNNGRIQLKQTSGDLEISKTVTGNKGEKDRNFNFTVTLKNPGGETPLTSPPNKTYKFTKTNATTAEIIESGSIRIATDGTVIFNGQSLTLKHEETVIIQGLPTGTYFTVTEADPNAGGNSDYETSVTVNGSPAGSGEPRAGSGTITSQDGEDIQVVVFTNNWTVPFVDFSFTKVDGRNTETPLQGAQFQLFELVCTDSSHDDSDHNQPIDPENPGDCWEEVDGSPVTSDADGVVNFGDLSEGIYRLVETKAPDGYALPKGQWEITIDPSKTDYVDQVKIQGIEGEGKPPAVEEVHDEDQTTVIGYKFLNYQPIDPPVTGGRGMGKFLLIGSMLMVLGIGGIECARRGARRYRQL